MKRKETIDLENALIKQTREKRIYGSEEITIGFYNQGLGNEIVDFMTMDSKGIIKCYEIKVTLQDFRSKAKKSWYGHYNYLVISYDLYKQIDLSEIPPHIGVIVGDSLESVRKCQRKNIPTEVETMLKESLVRSLYRKMEKYKDTKDIERYKRMEKRVRDAEKEIDRYRTMANEALRVINEYETYRSYNTGEDIDLRQQAKKEKEIFRSKRNGGSEE